MLHTFRSQGLIRYLSHGQVVAVYTDACKCPNTPEAQLRKLTARCLFFKINHVPVFLFLNFPLTNEGPHPVAPSLLKILRWDLFPGASVSCLRLFWPVARPSTFSSGPQQAWLDCHASLAWFAFVSFTYCTEVSSCVCRCIV